MRIEEAQHETLKNLEELSEQQLRMLGRIARNQEKGLAILVAHLPKHLTFTLHKPAPK